LENSFTADFTDGTDEPTQSRKGAKRNLNH